MMGARVTMKPQVLTAEMARLIEAQAEGAETFTLPGEVAVHLARLARQVLEKPGHQAGKAQAEVRTELQVKAYEMVRFFSAEQRLALRMALQSAVSQ